MAIWLLIYVLIEICCVILKVQEVLWAVAVIQLGVILWRSWKNLRKVLQQAIMNTYQVLTLLFMFGTLVATIIMAAH